jgi:dolichol-phosphate mannosyltransferase
VSDSLVIIPTYNEKENIEKMIRTVFALPKVFHLLIVDDGSPDGTADIIKRLQTEFPETLHIEERTGKLGLGTAYIHGFRWALKRGYEYIYEMDADFSHPPHKLIELYEACKKGADMSVGSRYTKGGEVVNWPMDRIVMSYGASLYVRSVTFMPVKDPTAGFVCYTKKVLEKINLDKIKFIGYAFQIEMKFATRQLGFTIAEVPISFKDREEGVSKMSLSIFKEAIFGVLKMRWWSMFNKYD